MSAPIRGGRGRCYGNYFRRAIVIKMVPSIGMGLSIGMRSAITRCWSIVILRMGQSRRRWADFNPTWDRCILFLDLVIGISDMSLILRGSLMRCWPNACLMLGQLRRRWPTINPTLGQRFLFSWCQLSRQTRYSDPLTAQSWTSVADVGYHWPCIGSMYSVSWVQRCWHNVG